jgi:hypothetical protein
VSLHKPYMNKRRSLLQCSSSAEIIIGFKYHLSSVEFISIAHSVLPGPASSSNRQSISFYPVQYRAHIDSALRLTKYSVELNDSAFRFTRYNSELKSTAHCVLPSTVSSSNRQRILLARSSVESISTAHCVLPGEMLSPNRQRIAFYQAKYRAQSEESTLRLPGTISSSNRQIICNVIWCFMWFCRRLLPSKGCLWEIKC